MFNNHAVTCGKRYKSAYDTSNMSHKRYKSIINKAGDDSDEDDDDNDNSPSVPKPSIPDIMALMSGGRKSVCRDGNHIYFRTDVNSQSVFKLINLIDEYNREHDEFKKTCQVGIITTKPLYLHITSSGGDVNPGFLAYDYIRNSTVPIYTIAEGKAVSMGSIMFMAGKRRFMTRNGYILIHQLIQILPASLQSKYNEIMDNTHNITNIMDKMYHVYLDNIRYPIPKPRAQDVLTKLKLIDEMKHDMFWDFDQCMKYGFVDEEYINNLELDKMDLQKITSGCNHHHGCRIDHVCDGYHQCDESHLNMIDHQMYNDHDKNHNSTSNSNVNIIDLINSNPQIINMLQNMVNMNNNDDKDDNMEDDNMNDDNMDNECSNQSKIKSKNRSNECNSKPIRRSERIKNQYH